MTSELHGKITVQMDPEKNIEQLCVKHIPGYDTGRFEVVAVRVFASREFVVTIYAADKISQKTVRELRYPVKKFKVQTLSMAELFEFVTAFNFTVHTEHYDIDDMDVINK